VSGNWVQPPPPFLASYPNPRHRTPTFGNPEPASAVKAAAAGTRWPTYAYTPVRLAEPRPSEVVLEAPERSRPDWQRFAESFTLIEENVEKVVQGKQREIRLALAAMVAEGHVLIEDVPGVGKTMLAKAIARSIDCSFRRIQFTPDLLPTDVTGVNVFNQERGDFEFKPGAIFANIVLGDEINRASPKTQSALLECMEERQITIDTETYQLGTPFMVIATQNPIEHEGTYPLPEAQLDRFMMRIAIGYPSSDVEAEILATHGVHSTLTDIEAVADALTVRDMIDQAREVHVAPGIRRYIVDVVEATRRHPDVYLGASPRASIMLLRAARAMAASVQRDYVIPDDIKALVVPVLAHRVIVTADAVMGGRTPQAVLEELVAEVPVPVTGTA
jgi:MoxR-like ATPase